MSDEPLTTVEEDIATTVGEKTIVKAKFEPSYRVVGDSKIPVPKKYGPLWKSRKEQAIKKFDKIKDSWDEAIRYFDNDQTNHRVPGQNTENSNEHLGQSNKETENIVFANITTMVAALYAKNIEVEFTATDEANEALATTLEKLVNTLISKKVAPGINLKPKARRGITTALCTNRVFLETKWVFKDDSSDKALEDLKLLSNELEKATEIKDIEEIEGKIGALEAQISFLTPPGPVVRVRKPQDVLMDPTAEEQDGSDAKWMIILDWLPTSFIKARFAMKKKGSAEEYESIYKPTHVLKVGKKAGDEGMEDSSFSLFTTENDGTGFGYDDASAFEAAKMTRVAYVWDKTTRRVFLYNDNDWTWPIWVWDDPLQLDSFYNVATLFFHDGPCGTNTKGEVVYYLDQQDAINESASEFRVARKWARRNVFYNKNLVSGEDVTAVLTGNDGTARGLNIPEGMKLSDIIGTVLPPSMQYEQLFDKQPMYAAIDRISGISQAVREGQFRTNSNKDAVKFGSSMVSMRIDDKSDLIEDWLSTVGWHLAQLCLINMPQESVAALIGAEPAKVWKNMSPEEIAKTFSMQVVGGSTKKPTSQAKKEEAIEVGQVLGQFVNAAPAAVIRIMLQLFSQAFDEINMRPEDWDMLKAEIEAQAQGQATQPGAQGQAQGQVPQTGDPKQDEINKVIAALPEQARNEMQQLIQQGVKPSEALSQIQQKYPQQ